jgi:hypothetical protein
MTLRKNLSSVWWLSVAILMVCVFAGRMETSFAQSSKYCDGYARDYADRASQSSSRGGALGGAARGAAGGALFGAIAGDAGKGAAIGAGVGAVAGGARKAKSWSYYYDQAYSECMRGGARK